jgi:putative transposase
MPWGEADALSERTKFIFEWERRNAEMQGGPINMSELCRMFGISRQTGYVWVSRYLAAGSDLRALQERPRRPHTNPRAVTPDVEELIVAARKQYPRWGPRLLRHKLVERYPRLVIPSASCIGAVLKRRGLTAAKRKTRRAKGAAVVTPPFASCDHPNDVWCMDFKGHFPMTDGVRCYPFTLLDGFSRLLLRGEPLLDPDGRTVCSILDSAFREYGLPKRLRSDGGPPFFAAGSPANLSRLSVWLLRLGIVLECIAPAKPQQNGRLERFHRTFKLEVEPAANLSLQRRVCDEFRRVYNFERPHSALGMVPPWSVYRRSPRRYPQPLLQATGATLEHQERLDRRGFLRWRRQRIFIGEALAGELVSLWPITGTKWEVNFGSILLGHFDDEGARSFVPRRRGKGSMRLAFAATHEWEPIES